jgi:hypothetical protein
MGWAWFNPVLALAAIGVGGYFALRGARGRPEDRATCWTHGLMALAMAPMFWPWGDPVPAHVGAVVFAVIGVWFVAARLRRGPGAPGDPTHVAVGCGAMVVMYLGMSTEHGTGTAGQAGHAGHAAAATGSTGLLLVALGLALTGYFAWHAWSTAAATDPAPPGAAPSAAGTTTAVAGRPRTAVRARMRIETAAHIVLDALMAIMFLGAL